MSAVNYMGVRPCVHIGRLRLHISDRLMEYFAALLMVGDAICLSIPGTMTGTFLLIRPYGIPDSMLATLFAIFGTIRVFALMANGNIPIYGPRARSICALVGAPVWALMAMSQFVQALHGHLSLALPTYSLLTIAEIVSAIRATYDVGRV